MVLHTSVAMGKDKCTQINDCNNYDCETELQEDTLVKEKKHSNNFLLKTTKSFLQFFSPDVDSTYIEPHKYNLTAMVQMTGQIDTYRLRSGNDYEIRFSPKSRVKFGPYFGWRWIFLGYTFDIAFLDIVSGNTDINFNIYTSAVGVNLLYRRLKGYNFKSVIVNEEDISDNLSGVSFPGLNIDIEGINLYYLLNHKRYSHQAIFNQTNRQIRSAGSLILGCGFNHHKINTDWNLLNKYIEDVGNENATLSNEAKTYDKIDYSTASASIGYGYNWVLSKNFTVGAQGIFSLAYIWSDNEATKKENTGGITKRIENFFTNNFTPDGSVKLGFVWNNSQWFAGSSAIFNAYNYHTESFWANNIFGNINVYVGYNFWKKK